VYENQIILNLMAVTQSVVTRGRVTPTLNPLSLFFLIPRCVRVEPVIRVITRDLFYHFLKGKKSCDGG